MQIFKWYVKIYNGINVLQSTVITITTQVLHKKRKEGKSIFIYLLFGTYVFNR